MEESNVFENENNERDEFIETEETQIVESEETDEGLKSKDLALIAGIALSAITAVGIGIYNKVKSKKQANGYKSKSKTKRRLKFVTVDEDGNVVGDEDKEEDFIETTAEVKEEE